MRCVYAWVLVHACVHVCACMFVRVCVRAFYGVRV